jgi:hypothetical protein
MVVGMYVGSMFVDMFVLFLCFFVAVIGSMSQLLTLCSRCHIVFVVLFWFFVCCLYGFDTMFSLTYVTIT